MCAAQDISVSPPAINDDSVAGRMLVAVEQRAQLVQMIAAGEGRIDELTKQLGWKDEEIAHLQEINQLKDEKIQIYVDKEKLYKDKEKTMQSFSDMKDKAYEEQLKQAKPTFWDNLSKYLTGAGAGAALTALAVILL